MLFILLRKFYQNLAKFHMQETSIRSKRITSFFEVLNHCDGRRQIYTKWDIKAYFEPFLAKKSHIKKICKNINQKTQIKPTYFVLKVKPIDSLLTILTNFSKVCKFLLKSTEHVNQNKGVSSAIDKTSEIFGNHEIFGNSINKNRKSKKKINSNFYVGWAF